MTRTYTARTRRVGSSRRTPGGSSTLATRYLRTVPACVIVGPTLHQQLVTRDRARIRLVSVLSAGEFL